MEINKVEDLLKEIGEFVKNHVGTVRLKLWFRGHSDINWVLIPGVYRSSFPKNDEDKRLEYEQSLTQDFRVFSAGLRSGNENDAELYFLQQHYGMPTRLLDWTNNPLAALFFAVAPNNNSQDGEIFLMDATQIAPGTASRKFNGHDFSGIATGTNPVFTDALKPISQWKTINEFPDFIIPVRPDYFDKRINLQGSCFTFHVPKEQELKKSNTFLTNCRIPSSSKASIMRELSLLGIDHFNIFGNLEGLASTLKITYKIG